MFRGKRPTAQPRTLRGIAEDKGTVPKGFDGSDNYHAGMIDPDSDHSYEDKAEQARASVSEANKPAGANPNPFQSLRRG